MKIKNGIIQDKKIQGIKFESKIIKPKGKANARTLTAISKPIYIVIHNTANTSPTAGADNHAIYMQNVENADKTYLSWHFTVDEGKIIQHLPLTEHGWHSGDGNGKGNKNGIAIEIAENKNYKKCEENAIKLIIELMNAFNVPIDRVQPHRYFATNKKLCPRNILKSEKTWKADWKAFQNRINKAKTKQDKPKKSTSTNTATKPTKPASTNSGGVKVGDIVYFKGGNHYANANASRKTNIMKKVASEAKITHIAKGAKYPYHLVHTGKGNVYGWVSEKDIDFGPEIKGSLGKGGGTIGGWSLNAIKKGDKVKVKKGAKTFDNKSLASFVYNQTYDVIQVKNNRAVIGKGKAVTAAVNTKDLTKV